jgi:hypothetical protein
MNPIVGTGQETALKNFADLIVNECINAVEKTPTHCAYTTFQAGIVDCTIEMSVQSIKQRFNIEGK